MNLKQFFTSKINWSAIVVMLLGLQDFITTFDFSKMTVKGWVTFAIGMAIVIFRTYFTNTQVATTAQESNNKP